LTQAQASAQAQLAAQTQLSRLQDTQLQAAAVAAESAQQHCAAVPAGVSGLTAAITSLSAPESQLNETLHHLRTLPTAAAGDTVQTGVSSMAKAMGDVTTLTRTSMDLLEKLLTPCMPVRVLRWAMSQSDKFYTDSNGLWYSLLKQDCGVTAQQMVALDELRATFKAAASKQHASISALYAGNTSTTASAEPATDIQQLLTAVLRMHRAQVDSNDECFNAFSSILSAEQMVKFLSWVERYGSVVVRINV